MTAGELVLPLLNPRLDERSGVYAAPLQMKAANGILLIDDFGRQAMPPRDLFNRWILPLDRRVDYLTLQYGLTFQIPFEVVLAFATNLDPAALADEAFLRRVPNKILIAPVSPEVFDEIFRRVVEKHGLRFEPELASHLRTICRGHGELRGCHPGDIFEILAADAAYRRLPVQLSRDNLDLAANLYFTQSVAADEAGRSDISHSI